MTQPCEPNYEEIARIKAEWKQMWERDSAHDEELLLDAFKNNRHLYPLRNALVNIPEGVGFLHWMDSQAIKLGLNAEWEALWRQMKCDSGAAMSTCLAQIRAKLIELQGTYGI